MLGVREGIPLAARVLHEEPPASVVILVRSQEGGRRDADARQDALVARALDGAESALGMLGEHGRSLVVRKHEAVDRSGLVPGYLAPHLDAHRGRPPAMDATPGPPCGMGFERMLEDRDGSFAAHQNRLRR